MGIQPKTQSFQFLGLNHLDKKKPEQEEDNHWEMKMEDLKPNHNNNNNGLSTLSSSSSFEESGDSGSSSYCSSDLSEDASSSSSSNGPLFELSDLMSQLPIKRGLSKYYEGKSQSFTSLANVKNVEDFKKVYPSNYNQRMKKIKSYGGGFDHHHHHHKSSYSPKATITKKSSRPVSIFSSIGKRHTLINSCRPA